MGYGSMLKLAPNWKGRKRKNIPFGYRVFKDDAEILFWWPVTIHDEELNKEWSAELELEWTTAQPFDILNVTVYMVDMSLF